MKSEPSRYRGLKLAIGVVVALAALSSSRADQAGSAGHSPDPWPTGGASPTPTPVSARKPTIVAPGDGTQITSGSEKPFTAYITGYSYWDNTPPGSAAIARPVIHRQAGGTGTYADPITLAVGHVVDEAGQWLDYPAGTRFYLAHIRKYAIVEDVCGDGDHPQYGPCHTGHNGHPWLDIYVGGAEAGKAASQGCARRITAVEVVVRDPAPDYPVDIGAIAESGCRIYK